MVNSNLFALSSNVSCTRAEIVRWVSESLRPFEIVQDRGFQSLMKTGRPEYYIPSKSTVSRDVRLVFARTRQRIAKMMKVSLINVQTRPIITKHVLGICGKA